MSSMWRPSQPLPLLLKEKQTFFVEIKSTQRSFSGPHHFIPIEITFLLMSSKKLMSWVWCDCGLIFVYIVNDWMSSYSSLIGSNLKVGQSS